MTTDEYPYPADPDPYAALFDGCEYLDYKVHLRRCSEGAGLQILITHNDRLISKRLVRKGEWLNETALRVIEGMKQKGVHLQ